MFLGEIAFTILIVMMISIPSALSGESEKDQGTKSSSHQLTHEPNIKDLTQLRGCTGIFIENGGQWDPEILFVADTGYGKVGFMRNGLIHEIYVKERIASESPFDPFLDKAEERIVDSCMIDITFDNSIVSDIHGEDPVSTMYNFFLGNEPSSWASNVSGYRSISYIDVWNGIDITYYFREGSLKYDIILAPGADPSSISMLVVGTEDLAISDDSLIIKTSIGQDLTDSDLIAYYQDTKEMIGSSFKLNDKGYGFNLDTYDKYRKVIIDPKYHVNAINYSTYFGGTNRDFPRDMIIDDFGNVFIIGETDSAFFPTSEESYDKTYNGNRDIFLLKFDSNTQEMVFFTYIGGSNFDSAVKFSLNDSNEIFIGGITTSSDFPVTPDAYCSNIHPGEHIEPESEICLMKIGQNGSKLLFSTYFGGRGMDIITGIEVTNNDVLIFSGSTDSDDFPITTDAFQKNKINYPIPDTTDIFIVKFNLKDMLLDYSTFIGGSGSEGAECMEYDKKTEMVFIGGHTQSEDFNVTNSSFQSTINSYQDGFLLAFNISSKNLTYSTFFGGSGYDYFTDLYIDERGFVDACGKTRSPDLFVTNGSYDTDFSGLYDGFFLRFNSMNNTFVYCSYMGGSSSEEIRSISRDNDGFIYIGGTVSHSNIEMDKGTFDWIAEGEHEGFYMKFDENGSKLIYSTYIGGTENDGVTKVIYDEKNQESIILGHTDSPDFPMNNNSLNNNYYGNEDIFLIKINHTLSPTKPMNLTAHSGKSFIELNWDPPLSDGGSPIDKYTIMKKPYGTVSFEILTDVRSTYFNDTNVENGKLYCYVVKAHNWIDYGPLSIEVSAMPLAIPSSPRNLTIDLTGDKIVKLRWEAPESDGGLPLKGYYLYKFTGSELIPERIPVVSGDQYSDRSVINGITYRYFLTVWNDLGESIPSNQVNATPMTTPVSIKNITVRSGPGFVHLTWDPPEDDGGRPILDYTIHRTDGDSSPQFLVESGVLEYNDTEVENGTRYWYQISSRNIVGSSPLSISVIGDPIGPPGPPQDLKAPSSPGTVELSWDPPFHDGGSKLLGYNVYRSIETDDWSRIMKIENQETTYTDRYLDNGKVYRYRVTAYNKIGESEPSSIIEITPFGTPGTPTDFYLVPGDGFINIFWNGPDHDGGSPVIGYEVFKGEKENDLTIFTPLDDEDHFFNDTEVINGKVYFYRILAKNNIGTGPSTKILGAIPGGLPTPPTSIIITPHDGYVDIFWDGPLDDGGFPITKVSIYRGSNENNPDRIFGTDQEKGSYRDKALVNGEKYYYSLTCMNSIGESSQSEIFEVTPVGKPSVPSSIQAKVLSSNSIEISWSPPEIDGGSPIQKYRVYRFMIEGGEPIITDINGNETMFEDIGLTAGRSYIYRVSASNSQGESELSEPVVASTSNDGSDFSFLTILIVIFVLVISLGGIIFFIWIRGKEKNPIDEFYKENG